MTRVLDIDLPPHTGGRTGNPDFIPKCLESSGKARTMCGHWFHPRKSIGQETQCGLDLWLLASGNDQGPVKRAGQYFRM